ncbi:zinc finger protein 37-like [Lingula anatina]|uniref:Zinc finger protein 37-like n=1 Tax=Lingula anatina TaxID=7574 RepID=A0A1S3HRF2_LINAN|nr:zinc finger protein 37-like [Lingula anatina]XP_013388613.1 zinc finger protein 37-like [Lingula anatina]|eukprot:XP_013388612.1 zinc finger protein 37-like [Lingula anatina]
MATGQASQLIIPIPPNWINIGKELERWNSLKFELQQDSNEKLAKLLMDVYNNYKPLTTLCKKMEGTSSDSDEGDVDDDDDDDLEISTKEPHEADHDLSSSLNTPDTRWQHKTYYLKPITLNSVGTSKQLVSFSKRKQIESNKEADKQRIFSTGERSHLNKNLRNADRSDARGQLRSTLQDVVAQDAPDHTDNRETDISLDHDYLNNLPNQGEMVKPNMGEVSEVDVIKNEPCMTDSDSNDSKVRSESEGESDVKSEESIVKNEEATIYICEICCANFTSEDVFSKHQLTHVKDMSSCRYCDETFPNKRIRDAHERTHSAYTPNMCQYCGRMYRQRAECVKHEVLVHSAEKPYYCKCCNKGFLSESGARYHKKMLQNKVKKPHLCQFCSRRFSVKAELEMHERRHTGEKPYTCRICGKTFSRKDSVLFHVRSHTGERPHQCRFCEKAFKRHVSRLKHEKAMHKKKPKHQCPHCPEGFKSKKDLRNHEVLSHN